MYETLKMMNQIISGKEKDKNILDLIKEYQETKNPSILAYFYSNNFNLIYITCNKYSKINNEDKASYCLEVLDKCLINFNINKKASFITYFIKCLNNRLIVEIKSKNIFHNLETIDLDSIKNLGYEDNYNFINKSNLNDLEIKQLNLLEKGHSFKEIANLLKISISYVYKINNSISKKILVN